MTPRITSTSRLLRGGLLFLASFAAVLATPVKFDIPAQPAPAALQLFIKQSGIQVLFVADELKAVTANAVTGEYEPAAALNILLKDTGYVGSTTKAGSFTVVREKSINTAGSVRGSLTGEGGKGLPSVLVSIRETSQSTETDRYGVFAFPNVAAGTYVLVASSPGYQTMHITDVQVKAGRELTLGKEDMRKAGEGPLALEPFVVRSETVEQLEKFIVTDSKPQPFSDRNVDLPRTINDVQPYYIFDSQKIEESGTTDVEDFLRQRLTMNTTVQTSSQVTYYQALNGHGTPSGPNGFTGQLGSSSSSINLNGLGANHTLILVNGIPMAGVSVFNPSSGVSLATPGQPDVNGIPLTAIDRIEVLPSSAGAIYGAGAVGGVINIILKKAYNGGDITATYGSTWDGYGRSRSVEATFGKSFEHGKTQLFVTAQFSDQSPMFVQDRINLLNRGYTTLLKNDPAYLGIRNANTSTNQYFPPVGSTPNFAATTTYTAVPSGYVIPSDATAGSKLVKNRPIGSYFNGAAVTAADPWILMTPPQPLTLKSTGAAIGGSNPYIATLPVGYGPNSDPSNIIAGAWNLSPGEDNEYPNGLLVPLGNYPRRKALMATLTREMTPNLQFHLDFSNNENHSYSQYNPIATQNGKYIPAQVPENPFNQGVFVSFPTNDVATATANTITNAFTVGGTLKLFYDWNAHLDYQWSESSFQSSYTGGVYNPVTYTAPTFYAYNSSNTFLGVPDANPTPLFAGSFNPFTDTLTNAPNLAPFRSGNYNTGKTTSNDLVLAASGPLMHLSWGEPRLSIRLEHNKSGQPGGSVSAITIAGTPYLGLPITPYTQTSFGQTQTTDNANAEFDVPIFKTKLPFLRSLDVQFDFGSVRRTTWVGTAGTTTYIPYAYSLYPNGGTLLVGPDSLSPNGGDFITPVTQQDGTISPASTAQPIRLKTVSSNTSLTGPAFSYKPIDDIIIRGSIANGYVPPSYDQLIPNVAPVTPAPYYGPISDPKNPSAGQYYITEIDEGNPNLRPQTSKSWDLGVVWEPQSGFLKGLRLDAEFSETKQFNLILQPGIQFFVSNESLYPNLVVRDQASGLVSTVYNQWINVAEAKQDAWTFTLDYPWRTAIGSFELTASETIQEHNSQQIAPGTLPLEYVGFPNSGGVAKTKATGSLRWSWRNWVAAWTTVYYGAYKQVGAPGDPEAYASALETNTPYTISTFYLLPQGGDTIPGQIYHNLYLSYTFRKETLNPTSRIGRWADAFMDGIKVSFGVNNVFNTLPAFDAYYAPFYASPFGDTKLRNYQFQIRKSF